MRKFVSIPTAFTGFANPAIFAPMAARNAGSLAQVYRKAEILFARLHMVRDRLKPWVALGVVDIDAFVDAKCATVADFEANFSALRVRVHAPPRSRCAATLPPALLLTSAGPTT